MNCLANKAKSPKNFSKFSLNKDDEGQESLQSVFKSNSEISPGVRESKEIICKTVDSIHISSLVSTCERKKCEEQKKEKIKETPIEDFTNREEISDFYSYTEECLVNIKKIEVPDESVIEKLKIRQFGFEQELKSRYRIIKGRSSRYSTLMRH